MRNNRFRTVVVAASAAAVLALAACGEREQGAQQGQTSREAGNAASEVKKESREALQEARQASEKALEGAREQVEKVEEKSREALDQARQQASRKLDPDTRAKEPGDPTAASGARGASSSMDDMQITTRVNAGLAADKQLGALRIEVDTRDGVVTLMGTAPTATAKARAAEVAREVKGVKSVNNQLSVAG